ncbi:hypothetical protein Tco_0493001 [Tanacetum coccineum]
MITIQIHKVNPSLQRRDKDGLRLSLSTFSHLHFTGRKCFQIPPGIRILRPPSPPLKFQVLKSYFPFTLTRREGLYMKTPMFSLGPICVENDDSNCDKEKDNLSLGNLSASVILNSLGNEDKVFKPGILVYHAIHDKNLVTLEENLKENISSGTLLVFKEPSIFLPPPEPPDECLKNVVLKFHQNSPNKFFEASQCPGGCIPFDELELLILYVKLCLGDPYPFI